LAVRVEPYKNIGIEYDLYLQYSSFPIMYTATIIIFKITWLNFLIIDMIIVHRTVRRKDNTFSLESVLGYYKILLQMKKLILLSVIFIFFSPSLFAESRIPKENYNWLQNAYPIDQGNIDRVNVVFLEIPDTETSTLYFSVRDPACDGKTQGDGGYDDDGVPDQDAGGTTTFYLIGGAGTLSHPDSRKIYYPTPSDARSGTILDSFSRTNQSDNSDAAPDYGWVYFSGVSPSQGEHIGNKYYFKVVVEVGTDALVYKNAYQIDISYSNSGTPSGVSDVRSFAYSWCVALTNVGNTWDIYPFVPAGATSDLQISSWDFDSAESMGIFDISNVSQGGVPVSGQGSNYPADVSTTNVSIAGASNGTNGTWRLRITEDANPVGMNVNTAEVWFTNSSTSEVYRAYSSYFVPSPVDHIQASFDDGLALADGTTTETVLFQVVDTSGNPQPYIENIYVTVSGSAQITGASNTSTGLPSGSALVTTDSDGLAWITVVDATVEIARVDAITDGSNDSDSLPGDNNSVYINFHVPGIGPLDHISIVDGVPGNEVNDFTIAVGKSLTLYAAGYDVSEQYRGLVDVQWSSTGTLDPITAAGAEFTFSQATTGSGTIMADDGYGHIDTTGTISVVSAIPSFRIRNNIINPWKGDEVEVYVNLTSTKGVSIKVYDLAGNLVKTLVNRNYGTGNLSFKWDGKSIGNRPCVQGVYFIVVRVGSSRKAFKVLVVK